MFVCSNQILGQLGPRYKGAAAIEDLVCQCQEYLAASDQAVFVPQNAFMPAPGGLLLSSTNLRLFLMGLLTFVCLFHHQCYDVCVSVMSLHHGCVDDCVSVMSFHHGNVDDCVPVMSFHHGCVDVCVFVMSFHY